MTLNIDTILFPTDFSDVAEGAFAHAAHLALQYNATIHVFNVVAPDADDASNPMDFLPMTPAEGDLSEETVQHVEVQTVTQERGTVPVIYAQTDSTSPGDAIIKHTTEHDVDLVVMGTHGRRGMERLLSGSVSEEVVRRAPCPVFTVLAQEDDDLSGPQIDRVLAPVDLSDQSKPVLHHAVALADSYAAPLDLLHVVEEASYPNVYGLDAINNSSLPSVQDRAREALETLAADIDLRTDPVNVHVLAGNPARDIVEFADDNAADLVVMATHGRTGLERFLIGSVAEKVVRRAPCPVFTLKSFGKSLLPEDDE